MDGDARPGAASISTSRCTAPPEKPVSVGRRARRCCRRRATIRREPEPGEPKPADELNVDAVFAKLKQIGGKGE
jgi:hypothetical protein